MTSVDSSVGGSWSMCSSAGMHSLHVRSDPEMEPEGLVETDSYTDVLSEILQTYEIVESAADMSRSPVTNDGNSLENARPNSANVSEWVEQQSLPMPAPKVVVSKSTPESKFETRQSNSGNLAGEDPQRRVYSISQLLSLGESIPMDHVELRIYPGALTEHIFKDKNPKAYPKFQEKIRHRGPSDHSTWTHRTNRSDEDNIVSGREWVNAQKVYRGPQHPPKEQFAQQHEGFKRFLKQVASPPHNRVTAGGRIVPAGPSFPPPMLNFGSIENTINPPVLKTSLSVNASTKPNVGGTDSHTTSHVLSGQQKINHNTNLSGLHQFEAGQVLDTDNANRGGFESNISMVPTMQFPQGIEPLYWLAGGGAIVSLNGAQYRASWNGPQLVLESLQTPMQAAPFFTMTPEHAAIMYAQVNHGCNYPTAVKPVTASETPTNFTNTTSAYTSYQLPPRNPSSRSASQEEHENLRARLTELDKHLALYHHKLSVFEHSVLVAQRKQLVENIDFIRKNRNEHTNSSSEPAVGPHTTIGMQPLQRPKHAENIPPAIVPNGASSVQTQRLMGNLTEINTGAAQATLLNKKPSASSTCLSPDAPPFFPSNIKAEPNNPSLGYPWGVSAQSKNSFGNLNTQNNGRVPVHGSGIEVSHISQATQATHLATPREGRGANGIASRSEESGQEPLPVVLQEDADYADRLGLNPARGAKLYCTTVPEFQKVIRRVREQARLYGCKGGQSKDPAFDAEQDIRWAMADHDPIRLPGSTPDHAAEPCPWSWNDSIFNAQTGNGSASLNGHSSQTYVTSNSQEKSSGGEILDDPFSVFTQRRGNYWDSDPGANGAVQYAVDHKQSQYRVTATDPGVIAQDSNCQSRNSEPQGAPSTPKFDRKRSLTLRDVSNGSAIHTPSTSNKGKTPQLPRHSSQSYVDENFGTPTSGRILVTSREYPASAKKDEGPSKLGDRSEHLNSRSCSTHRVWDLETGQFITLDDCPTEQTNGTVCPSYDNCPIGPTDPTVHRFNQDLDSWAPITDSKSRWGPEEDTESLDAWGIPKSYDWVAASTPRVNIPFATPKSSPQPAGYVPPELRKAKRPVNDFLRGILKSPQYAYPRSSQSVSSAAEMHLLRLNHRADLEKRARDAINKENLKGEAQRRMERTTAHDPSSSTLSAVGQDHRKHKARSSLASSTFQVQGHLGRTGHNAEHVDSSSQAGYGYAPQHPRVKRHSQILGTPRREGPPDCHFPTEVRQEQSRSSIPQYDGALDDMTGMTDCIHHHSSKKTTPITKISKHAISARDGMEFQVDDDYINNQYPPARHEVNTIASG
ncbi:hypothetical protein MMC07_008274 [Pseudocyphellaria aurata]|nr:hypothetical protein [Pseudocyphellaria aurata]